MGVEVVVEKIGALRWPELLAKIAPASIVMVDGGLVMPGAAPADAWRDVRVKTQAGTFAVKRTPGGGVAVVAFGNADEGARAMQARIAEAIAAAAT
ncbi:MAG: hypothetical protein ACXVCV_14345 [Polyangia bacterium]